MIKINEVIVVEGKYDKIKLSSIVDGLIIETDGFGIYNDREKLELLRKLAPVRGVLILTDSDAAGFQIRSYLNGCLPKGTVKHAYIPDIYGKEKRKDHVSKEGKLGVEGIDAGLIIKALEAAGVSAISTDDEKRRISKTDLFELGLTGGTDSAERRKRLLHYLGCLSAYLQIL